MKLLKVLLSIVACLCLSVSSIHASTPDYFGEMSTKISGFVQTYRDIGMTSAQLANIMNVTYKTDQQSYSKMLKNNLPEETHLLSDVQPKVSIDGNPPVDDAEAEERYNYIRSVLVKEYSDDKYKDKKDKYFGYLYASHYIENTAYDRNNLNFDNMKSSY